MVSFQVKLDIFVTYILIKYTVSHANIIMISVSGVPAGKRLRITICNMNRQSKLYSQGMAPVFRVVPGLLKWDRIKERPTYEVT